GELWLSHRVRQALAQRLAADELTEVAIPASARRLKLWRARGMSDSWARRSALPFVGRQAELRQFDSILRDCFTARSGRVVVVRGDAGIGKSRLLEACAGLAREQGFACHKTLVLDFGGGGGPIEALVRELVDLAPDAPPAAGREAAEAAVAQGWIGQDLVVFLHDFLDLPQPKTAQRVLQAMDNATRNRGRQAVVDELVRGRSARQPRLIVVEDIHWADAVVLDHLARLAAAIREFPVILVLSTRPENDPVGAGWRAAAGGTPRTTIDLGPLSDAEAALLATHYGAHDQGFVHACVARAEGNPLFLDQLLRAGEERGALPGSVQSLVLARLDRLDPADRQAVQAAAVLGQRFSLAGLRALVADPDYACTALAEQALVRPEGEGWLFAHALIHEAVYASVLKSKRQALHRLAAAWYAADDATLVAEHLDAAGDAAAADAYWEAARGEAGQYRYERALGLAERGLTLADQRRLQHRFACLRGDILRELGRTVDSVAAFRQAIEFADGARERCHALIGVAAGLRVLDRYDEALPVLAEAQAAAVELDDAEALAEIHFVRGNIYFPRGEVAACRRAHEQALAHARAAGSALAEARALGGLGDAYYQEGRMRSARDHFDRCIALAREHGFVRIELANLPMLAVLDIYLADPEAVTRHCHAALDLAARIGDLRGEMLTRDILSAFQHMRGAWVLSRAEAERSLELARRLGAQRFEAEALAQIGLAAHGLGDTEEAARLLDAAWALTRVTGPQYIGPTVLGFIAQTTHDPDRRRWALAEGEALLAAGCVSHAHLYFYDAAIAASLGTGEWEAAERYADALSAYVRDEPLPWTDFASACGRCLARVGRGERDDALHTELRALRATALEAQWTVKLPEIDAALARMEDD
ncbi:MAG: AAA family ATPase, partial [Rubritepida sp.]|nr:AAA family ATPase [Rubritepida sp.]